MEKSKPADLNSHSFNVLSYNVNFAISRGNPDNPEHPHHRVLSALKECATFDVLCLQETNAAWEHSVRRALGDSFPYQQWYDIGVAGGSAILSKTPFTATLFQPVVSGTWFSSMIGIVEIGGRKIHFINVHLRPPLYDDGSAGIWSASSTNPVRLAEIKGILEHLGESIRSTSTIILGDFNEEDSAPGLKHLKANGFVDAVEQFVPSSQETHRWPLWIFTLKHRLDHITYNSAKLKCNSCAVMKAYAEGASDHQPIRANFSFL